MRAAASASAIPLAAGAGFAPYKAFIYYRPSGAPLPIVVVEGHVGWGFQDGFGTYVVGSVENYAGGAYVPAERKGAWIAHVTDPFVTHGTGDPTHKGINTRYDLYKVITVPSPNPSAALSTAIFERDKTPYEGLRNNCTDYVRKVLRAYGVEFTPPQLHPPSPKAFWESLGGGVGSKLNVTWPNSKYDIALYTGYDRKGLRDQLVSMDGASQFDLECEGASNDDPSLFRVSNIVVRRGYIAVYDTVGLEGGARLLGPGTDARASEVLPSGEILSWFAAADKFGARNPPRGDLEERFPSRAAKAQHLRNLRAIP